MRAPLIEINLCCNDPTSGRFLGRVCIITVPVLDLEIEALRWGGLSTNDCPKMALPPKAESFRRFRLAGKFWDVSRYAAWTGNLAWNSVWMPEDRAVDFLCWLHGRRLFQCVMGRSSLYSLWQSNRQMSRSMVARLFRAEATGR
jgi:hypothetical protein